MKKQIINSGKKSNRFLLHALCVIACSLCSFASFAQSSSYSLNKFFNGRGARILADAAHPSNNYSYSECEIYGNKIFLDIHYDNGVCTSLEISKYGDFFNIDHVKDNDFPYAFSAIWLLKQTIPPVDLIGRDAYAMVFT